MRNMLVELIRVWCYEISASRKKKHGRFVEENSGLLYCKRNGPGNLSPWKRSDDDDGNDGSYGGGDDF
jgi:hypothetical protein